MDSQTQMKQVVADEAIKDVKDDMILGLGSGSTAALMIKSLADEIRSGKLQNIRGVATSFQSEVLALELDIPLIDLASVSQIDLAIDGADEVDPGFQLIKGGGACHVREKLVASKANQLLIVVSMAFAFLIPPLKNTSRMRLPWSVTTGPAFLVAILREALAFNSEITS